METTRLNVKNPKGESLVCEINKSESPESMVRPSILILHALTGKKENSTINFLAKHIPNHGYDTVQFDFSGHGESEGKLENATVTKQLEDITAVLRQVNHVNKNRVILVGNSFSVVTALAYATVNKSIIGLILLSGRANYMKYFEKLEKNDNNQYKLPGPVFVDESFVDDYRKHNPLENVKSFKGPILIIHGENDETIPKEDAGLFYSASTSTKKRLFIVPKAGHRYSGVGQKNEVLDKIVQFLDENYGRG